MITLPEPVPATLDLRSAGRLLLSLAGRQRWTLLAAGLMGSLWMLAQAAVPLVVGRTVQAGLVQRDRSALLIGCLLLAGLGLACALAGLCRHRLAVANWMQASLRSQQVIGYHVTEQGLAVGAVISTGEVVETVSTDATRIGDLFDVVARGSGAVISYLVVTVLLLRLDLLIGCWVAVGVPLLGGVLAVAIRPLQRRQKQHRAREGELTALGADTVAGLRVLRGIGGEQQFLHRYRERSQQVRQTGGRVASVQAGLDAAHVLLPGVFVVTLTWLAAQATRSGRLNPGELVTIYGYAAFLRMPLETATEVLSRAVQARVAASRIIAVLSRSDQADTGPSSSGTAGRLELPPAGALLADPESGLRVRPGLLTAIVTARPEQAIALADRLAQLTPAVITDAKTDADPADDRAGRGIPQLDGVPLDRLALADVRARILLSEAEPRLFTGSLRAEIDPHGGHSDDEVLAALQVADATDLLEALPDGLDSRVEERGREFSGGQRQRLVLARAVLADPEILVLVEPTSSVDAHTEARLAQRLRVNRAGRTTLLATASPLLLELCDHVVLLVDGRATEQGSHRDLVRDSPAYRDVVLRGSEPPPHSTLPAATR